MKQAIQRQRQLIMLQIKRQSAIQAPKKNPFQTDKFLRESPHRFDTHKKLSMNNAIAYVAPKTRR